MKYAVLSMDIEDWYHLDYFRGTAIDIPYSMLDGVDEYRKLLSDHEIKTTFFTLGEIAESFKHTLIDLNSDKHEIAAHGWNHKRPLTMDKSEFYSDITKTKSTLEQIVGKEVTGYRAPCFSLDRSLLNKVEKAGFLYDSSRIDFSNHSLYGEIDLNDYREIIKNIYLKEKFFEFEVSTYPLRQKPIPVSGGGYIRIFPWVLMKRLLNNYLKNNDFFVLYIHPFELSSRIAPQLPNEIPWYIKQRFKYGRNSVKNKINKLIILLKEYDFNFVTFTELRKILLTD